MLSELGVPRARHVSQRTQGAKERRHTVEGTDRTITWKRWQEMPRRRFQDHHQVATAGKWYGTGFHTRSKFSDAQLRSVDAVTHSAVNRKDRAGSRQ